MVNPMVPVKAADASKEFVFWDHGHKLDKNSLDMILSACHYDLTLNVNFKSFEITGFIIYLLLS
jgi:hypothetical protein